MREILAPFTGHPYDFEVWTRLGVYMQGLMSPYTDLPYYPGVSFSPQLFTGSISYPPFSAFMFTVLYRVYLFIGSPSRFVYYFLLKQPIVISDVLIAILLARIILMFKGPSSARIGFLVWIYFPPSILVSSVWGALDPIALLLILLAVFFLLTSRELASASSLGLAIFLKAMPVVALPVLVMSIRTGVHKRLRYGLVSLAIPALGTLVPVLLFNWGFNGLLNNFAFQADIPGVGGSFGELSFLGRIVYTFSSNESLNLAIGLVWVPTLLLAYFYIERGELPILQGVLVSILAFSVARPFLSEQWAVYPLALLLGMINQKNIGHLVGLSISATAYLLVNNMLLLKFLRPVSTGIASWNLYGTSPVAQSINAYILLILAGLFFVEALMTMGEKESILYRIIRTPASRLRHYAPERASMKDKV